MKRLTIWSLLALNAYWIGIAFMWNSLHPLILPAVLLNFVPENYKNTYLGVLTFIGLMLAMVIQPLAGAISDRWSSRWGRRRPFILAGTLVDFVFLALLAWSGGLVWVIVGYIGLQLSSNIAHGPFQGLLPDRVPREQMGMASGLKNLMDMGGLIAASLLAGRLLDPETRHPFKIMMVVIGVLAVSAIITLLGTKEDIKPVTPDEQPFSLRSLFQVDVSAHTTFWWVLGARFAFLLGIYGIQSFTQYYLRDALQVPNPIQQTGDLLAALTLSLVAFAVGGGWACDRFGSKVVSMLSGVLGIVGCLLLLLARTPTTLLAFGSVLGAGIGLFLTANWTQANNLVPVEEAGKFMGLTNLATAGAGAFGRLEGPLIDVINRARPGAYLGYTMMFILGAVGAAVSIVLVWRASQSEQ